VGFKLHSPFSPCGDQPGAIQQLVSGIVEGKKAQVLLGITGSGKTYTMANVIEKVQKPTLIIAHNKTLAAQLFQEFKTFFPDNAVEYFVSYYDYYQPEAYIPRSDTYIEKDFAINDTIDKLRLSATRSLCEREDVIIVASVSCIYGLGAKDHYRAMSVDLEVGGTIERDELLRHFVAMRYTRNDLDFQRSSFRARGDVVDIFPAYEEERAVRIELFGDEVEALSYFDPLTGKKIASLETVTIWAGSHFVTPENIRLQAVATIRKELDECLKQFEKEGKLLEKQRLFERTMYDIEMIKEVGYCKGVENYSRHFSPRPPGEPPSCLIDYFPEDFLLIIDESHQTVPQIRAMREGDRSRKRSLIDFGFRLPSAYDNRPLSFHEFYERMNQTVYVSATPAVWEQEEAEGEVIEQIIRPTGLLDPLIEKKPASGQVDDVLHEIALETEKGNRVLVTTLTKRMAEQLSGYLEELSIKVTYLHSDVDTLERIQIIHKLRTGEIEVLVGVNLLREGLDIPEVSLVAVLDADKEGFLRSETALTQTCGRAARNMHGRVILYADKETQAIKNTVAITKERRARQEAYNKKHKITPQSVTKEMGVFPLFNKMEKKVPHKGKKSYGEMSREEILSLQKEFTQKMKRAAKEMDFESAALFRDEIRLLEQIEVAL